MRIKINHTTEGYSNIYITDKDRNTYNRYTMQHKDLIGACRNYLTKQTEQLLTTSDRFTTALLNEIAYRDISNVVFLVSGDKVDWIVFRPKGVRMKCGIIMEINE